MRIMSREGNTFWCLQEKKKKEETVWKQMSIEEHMAYYESQGMDHKEAMKLVAKDRGVPKREIYRALIKA